MSTQQRVKQTGLPDVGPTHQSHANAAPVQEPGLCPLTQRCDRFQRLLDWRPYVLSRNLVLGKVDGGLEVRLRPDEIASNSLHSLRESARNSGACLTQRT